MEQIEEILMIYETVEKDKTEAAKVLQDEIFFIRQDLGKANLILSEIQSDYFNRYTPSEDNREIIREFEKFKELTEIVSDYLQEAEQLTEELQDRAN